MMKFSSLDSLSDSVLLGQFVELVRQDHEGNANLLRHIDTIERRKIWAKQGHPSMFDFLVTRHHMSESTAGKRIGAARTARRFPVLFGMVARGEIHLSGIHRLKAHLTPENHASVLDEAKHKTIRQIEQLVARLAPKPDVPSVLRALPSYPPTQTATTRPTTTSTSTGASVTSTASAPASTGLLLDTAALGAPEPPKLSPRRAADPVPLSPGRFKLQVTIGEGAHDKLKQLKDLLAHQIPNGDLAAIIERALDALLTEVHKRKTGINAKPRAPKSGAQPPATLPAGRRRTRYIPVAVRREVWPRDEGRCGFVGEDGHCCNETRGLEFAHVHPWAKGGDDTTLNVGLRCPAHNALEADRDYGASFMGSKRKRRQASNPLKVREATARYFVRTGPADTITQRLRGGPVLPRTGESSSERLRCALRWCRVEPNIASPSTLLKESGPPTRGSQVTLSAICEGAAS